MECGMENWVLLVLEGEEKKNKVRELMIERKREGLFNFFKFFLLEWLSEFYIDI